jgi:hypothetical protein
VAGQICRSIQQEALDQAKRTRFWHEMAAAGAASMAMTIDIRHDLRTTVAIQVFGRDFGCRWHFGD